MTRVAELTLKFLDSALSDAEWAELDSLLERDPRAELEHLELLELEAELRGLLTDLDVTDATLDKIRDAQADRTADAVLAAIRDGAPPAWARTEPQEPPRRRRWVMWSATVACAAAAVVGVWLGGWAGSDGVPSPDENAPQSQAFAKLLQKTGFVEVFNPAGDAVSAEEGSELPLGFTLRTGDDSHAVVDLLADRARFEIESGTVVRFRDGALENASKPQLFLAAGQLTAAVPERPEDRPLVVGTPVTDVFARGGLFVVSSAGPDTARVDIRKGKVDLVRAAAPKPVRVGVGSAVVTAGFDRVDIEGSPAVDRVPVRTLPFVGARDATYSPDGSEVWVANARAFARCGADSSREMTFYARKAEGFAGFASTKRHLITFRDDRVLVRTLPDGGEHAALDLRIADRRFWAVAPDGSWVASVEARPPKRVRLLDSATGETRFQFDVEGNIGSITASPDGRVLAVGLNEPGRNGNNRVQFLDASTGARLSTLPTQRRPLTALTYSADGRLLAAGFNGAVQVWDVRARELLRTITGFERALSCLAFSPDAERLVAGAGDGSVWVWHVPTGKQTQLIEPGGRGVRALAFSPDGRQLVTVPNAAPVAVWPVKPAPAGDLQ